MTIDNSVRARGNEIVTALLTQPFPRATLEYAPSDLKIEPFNCSPVGLTGTLRR